MSALDDAIGSTSWLDPVSGEVVCAADWPARVGDAYAATAVPALIARCTALRQRLLDAVAR